MRLVERLSPAVSPVLISDCDQVVLRELNSLGVHCRRRRRSAAVSAAVKTGVGEWKCQFPSTALKFALSITLDPTDPRVRTS